MSTEVCINGTAELSFVIKDDEANVSQGVNRRGRNFEDKNMQASQDPRTWFRGWRLTEAEDLIASLLPLSPNALKRISELSA